MLLKEKFWLKSVLVFLFLNTPIIVFAGSIDFKDFKLYGKPSNYQINTRIEYELTEYLTSALQNGVTLNARIQFRLGEHRSWWFNKDMSLLTISYQLKYHALSSKYLLTNNDTSEQWIFSSTSAMLRKLGELKKYSLPDISNFLSGGDNYIFAIADIFPATLRLPLRIQSIFSDQYSITSEGVLWPLP